MINNIGEFIFLFLMMLWFHVTDDFVLQDVLARMKQKDWWRNLDDYNEMYKHDYKISLLAHGFSNAVMFHIPVIFYMYTHNCMSYGVLSFTIIFNTIIHTLVDNSKANLKMISLVIDQFAHICQVLITLIFINVFVV